MRLSFLVTSLALHLLIARLGSVSFSSHRTDYQYNNIPVFISTGQISGRVSPKNSLSPSVDTSLKRTNSTKGPSIQVGNPLATDEFVFREEEIVRNGNTLPKYPQQALERGIQGTVLLKLTLSVDGEVSQSEVIESSGSPLLDLAAFSASKSWTFKVHPPVKKIIAPIRFVIES